MSTLAPPQEQEQIVGTVTEIVTKGVDKWQIVVREDGSQSQYGRKLWTKDQPLVQHMAATIGTRYAFLCNVSHWTNQQTGQPVRSLWIEAAGPPAVGTPAMTGPPQVAPPPQQPVPNQGLPQPQTATVVQPTVVPMQAPVQQPQPDLREQKIHRQTAAKVAAILIGYLPEADRTLATLLLLSERLVAYFDHGYQARPPQTVEDLINQAMPMGVEEMRQQQAAQGAGYDNTPPPSGDDDIPF